MNLNSGMTGPSCCLRGECKRPKGGLASPTLSSALVFQEEENRKVFMLRNGGSVDVTSTMFDLLNQLFRTQK